MLLTAVNCRVQRSVAVSDRGEGPVQASPCSEGAGDWAAGPTLPHAERVDLMGSRSRGFHVASQRGVPGGQGGFAWAVQIWKDPSENFRATTRSGHQLVLVFPEPSGFYAGNPASWDSLSPGKTGRRSHLQPSPVVLKLCTLSIL